MQKLLEDFAVMILTTEHPAAVERWLRVQVKERPEAVLAVLMYCLERKNEQPKI